MPETISIPSRFNGPLESGNGGYSSGVVAGLLGGAAEVTLRRPVPLDTPLRVERGAPDTVRVEHAGEVVMAGSAAPGFKLDVPPAPSLDEARAATGRYRAPADGVFSRCFVCGRARPDAFGVFAGEVEGRGLVASPWTPYEWTAGADGTVAPEFVWSVLDCPTYFAIYMNGPTPAAVLARMTGRIHAPVETGREHVVIAWPLESDGRKRHAGAAVVSAAGEVLAVARALLIEPRPQ